MGASPGCGHDGVDRGRAARLEEDAVQGEAGIRSQDGKSRLQGRGAREPCEGRGERRQEWAGALKRQEPAIVPLEVDCALEHRVHASGVAWRVLGAAP